MSNSTKATPARIVLAYSGGSETTLAIRWLTEQYQCEVVTMTLDLGQPGDLTDIRERALAAGAVRAHVIDAREEFVREYIWPALQAHAFSGNRHALAAALGESLIAKRLVDVARMEGSSAVAHGDSLAGRPSRIDVAIRELASSLTIVAPSPRGGISRADQPKIRSAAAENLWTRSVGASAVEPSTAASDSGYTRTRDRRDCPDDPAYVEIDLDAGIPVRANGIEMPPLELIESLEIIAGAHGVGRVQPTGAGLDAQSRVPFEAPSAVLVQTAYEALQSAVVAADLVHLEHDLGAVYADLIREGHWFSQTRHAIDAFLRTVQPRVTGTVRLKLFKGSCRVYAVHVTGTGPSFQHSVAEGLVS